MYPKTDEQPLYIKVHEHDNVAIVVNSLGLPAGTQFADGLTLTEHVPQGHKVALRAINQGAEIVRYGEVIGYALRILPRAAGLMSRWSRCRKRLRWRVCR